ncbi:phage distal tail protein domain-containing protein [Oenococcus sicerae]|uniref:phage distal tail protein domain-containing protein n=1 Tax=Oenococcus sicerae TaxID=2203724 RepID=UPI0039EAD97C
MTSMFQLANSLGQTVDINTNALRAYTPTGLGIGLTNTYGTPIGGSFIKQKSILAQSVFQVYIKFGDVESQSYQSFADFAQFLNYQPYTLTYVTDAGTWFRDANLQGITKTEIGGSTIGAYDHLNETFILEFINPWYQLKQASSNSYPTDPNLGIYGKGYFNQLNVSQVSVAQLNGLDAANIKDLNANGTTQTYTFTAGYSTLLIYSGQWSATAHISANYTELFLADGNFPDDNLLTQTTQSFGDTSGSNYNEIAIYAAMTPGHIYTLSFKATISPASYKYGYLYNPYYVYIEENQNAATQKSFLVQNKSHYFGLQTGSPCLITIEGPVTNPSWKVFVDSKVVASDAYNLTLVAGEKLVISSFPENQYCRLYTADGHYTNVYAYQDPTLTNFVTLPPDDSSVVFYVDSTVKVSLDWKLESLLV